ncbi:MAG: thiamine phosphate synthase [Actinomycetota bacterium]|nr:thiamine phosphate synthase [Actinomycetota bacterium]
MIDLAGARLYLVASDRVGTRALAEMVPELAAAGVDLLQLRMKDVEAGDLLRAGEPVATACREAGIPFIVNDRPDGAVALEADGVHVGQNDVPVALARRIVGDAVVGLSTHAPAEVDAALASDADYLVAGPVYATPTKPGRPATGLELVRYAARRIERPWFAIGGIDATNLEAVLAAGARRIVVVRAITEADDPPAAAARLAELLAQAP